jgi:hypothetical protein
VTPDIPVGKLKKNVHRVHTSVRSGNTITGILYLVWVLRGNIPIKIDKHELGNLPGDNLQVTLPIAITREKEYFLP